MDAHTRRAAIERIRWLCEELMQIAPDDLAGAVGEVRASIDEPLRIAVVGRVKAGKSTLVNALIGTKTAATDATECTRIVTWYRYGIAAPTELVLRGGGVRTLAISGRLPEDLPLPAEEISHAVVYLQEQALQEMTLIDTPGLETSTASHELATRRAVLGASGGVSTADAILYVFTQADRSGDLAFVREFHHTAGIAAGVGHSIGVLSRADMFGTGPWGSQDPIDAATAFAAETAARHAGLFAAVVAVAGRMAQAARAGDVREADARALARLVDLDDLDLQDLENDPPGEGSDAEGLTRVLAHLRGYPLRHGRAAAAGGAGPLSRWLLARSGYSALAIELRERYLGLGVQLTVRQSLVRLRDAARTSPRRAALDERIETARIDPALHLVRELEARELLVTRSSGHPLIDELGLLMSAPNDRVRLGMPGADAGTGAEELYTAARRRANDHVAGAALTGDSEVYNAHIVLAQSYRLLAGRHTP